ncbi:hypothetical protein LCGC14_2901450 [marine sediment metagenome]|uniref:Uncharacterized protein n=1 Tax=marine sediment metagenome TaxID=412755 RepID=A0A0F8XU82_9ZZZZ
MPQTRAAISSKQTATNQGLTGIVVAFVSKLLFDAGYGEIAVMAAPILMALLTFGGTIVRNIASEKGWAKWLP